MPNTHGMCEDYRASTSIDLEHDKPDIDKKNKVKAPLATLWGAKADVPNEAANYANHAN
jgi:haloacetate dehalogenase